MITMNLIVLRKDLLLFHNEDLSLKMKKYDLLRFYQSLVFSIYQWKPSRITLSIDRVI